MSSRTTAMFVLLLMGFGCSTARAQDAPAPLADLDVLTRSAWQGSSAGFSTTLRYRWIFEGRTLEVSNIVRNESGGVMARYHGTYTWDAGRREIVFWTAGEGGEVHRGRAWWQDGVLWHEAEVSGGRIEAYVSAVRPGPARLEYFAAYGERKAGPGLLQTKPIAYDAVKAPPR